MKFQPQACPSQLSPGQSSRQQSSQIQSLENKLQSQKLEWLSIQEKERQLRYLTTKFNKLTLVPDLPTELRLKIWRHAMPGLRIVEVPRLKVNAYSVTHISYIFEDQPIVTLNVYRESREETLRRYTPMFLSDWNDHPQVYVDCNVDTCHFVPPKLVRSGHHITISELDRIISRFMRRMVAGLSHEFLGILSIWPSSIFTKHLSRTTVLSI
jgi:hypothetical protein